MTETTNDELSRLPHKATASELTGPSTIAFVCGELRDGDDVDHATMRGIAAMLKARPQTLVDTMAAKGPLADEAGNILAGKAKPCWWA